MGIKVLQNLEIIKKKNSYNILNIIKSHYYTQERSEEIDV